MRIYVAAVEALRNKETQDGTQFTTKIGGKKTSLDPSYFLFVKIFIPSYAFDALVCRNWLFSPPNCLTLPITLVYNQCQSCHGSRPTMVLYCPDRKNK